MALPDRLDDIALFRAASRFRPRPSLHTTHFAGMLRGAHGAGAVRARLLRWRDDREPSEVQVTGCPGSLVRVAFSGSIDNLRDLTDELVGRGHGPAGCTPAEAIAHAYEQWGEGCIERLWGMFAVALWDERAGILLLARDRTGARSVYYSDLGDRLVFGSHITALRAVTDVAPHVDPQAIDCYLTFGAVPAPLSIYRSVRQLSPAHLLKLDDGNLVVKRYWTLRFQPKQRVPFQEAVEQFEGLLRDVVGRAANHRRPAIMLSGGLDSAILLAQLATLSSGPMQTFTCVFSGRPGDAEAARGIAMGLGSISRVFRIEPRVADVVPEIVSLHEQPYANPSAVSLHYMWSSVRGEAETVFSGEGADEVFSGRERHLASEIAGLLQRVPVGRLTAAIGGRLPAARLSLLFKGVALGALDRHMLWVSVFQPFVRARLYTPEFTRQVDPFYARTLTGRLMADVPEPLEQEVAADVGLWMPDVVWPSLDPNRGAAGLAVLAPFLDHRMVEFSASLPASLKVRRLTPKAILRRSYARHLPGRSLRLRPGPKIPLAPVLRAELRSTMEDTLLSARALQRGYFRPTVVRQLIREHLTQRADHARQLWTLMMLEQWHRRWLDGGG